MDCTDQAVEQTRRRRQPSINSSNFAVPAELDTHTEDTSDSYESQEETAPLFDPVEYLQNSLDSALSSIEFNKSLARQAQLSGQLKSKEFELLKLQEEAHKRLIELQKLFKEGLKDVHTVSNELKQANHRIRALNKHAEGKYPIEFSQAREKVLSRNIADDDQTDEIYI
jgi:hypothetical protein